MKKGMVHVENHSFAFTFWLISWLFTIGFLHLSFWRGVLAFVNWPYLLGLYFAG